MYARLSKVLKTGVTVGEVMKEIVRVLTGDIVSTSQLTVFDPTTSKIIPGVGTNWYLVYPTVLTASSNSFVLASNCLTSGKTKYIRLLCKGSGTNQPFIEPTGGTANVYQLTSFSASTTVMELHSCTGVNTTTGAITGSSYYHYTLEGIIPGATNIYLSVSPRHVLMHGNAGTLGVSTTVSSWGLFECPENTVTLAKSLRPVISYRGNGTAESSSILGRDTAVASTISTVQVIDGYNIMTNTANTTLGAVAGVPILSTFGFTGGWSHQQSPGARGAIGNQIIARDHFFYDSYRGHSLLNASTLTNVRWCALNYQTDTEAVTLSDASRSYTLWPVKTGAWIVPLE